MSLRFKFPIAVVACTISFIGFYSFTNYSDGTRRWLIRHFGDVMDWRSRWIAGKGALNCGTVKIGGNAETATSCALQAFAAHRTFRVRYTLKTFDIDMAAGLVAAKDGTVYEMIFWGGAPIGTDVIRQRAFLNLCPTPISLHRTKNGRVSCFLIGNTLQSWSSSYLSDAP